MKFHRVPVSAAKGAILAHATQALGQSEGRLISKGTILTTEDIEDLFRAGAEDVLVAELEAGDVPEDEAALRLAQSVVAGRSGLDVVPAPGGRVNLKAASAGIVDLEADRLLAMNRIDPGITIATVPPWRKLGPGGLAATIKIIPFAVASDALDRAAAAAQGAMGLATSRFETASLIETRLAGSDPGEKGRRSTTDRLAHFGVELTPRSLVDHSVSALADALGQANGDLLLILTGTATSDARDTAPEAVRAAGGQISHYGMPVDPGNLIFLGALHGKPVIGLPGCARSPAPNGADWVLERVLCGRAPTPDDIMAMGVGGLLKETKDRGRQRDP